MSKTTIKELASSLSDKHDLSKADAERFVAAIFEVINDGLEDDKLVKVKGLGAFKIIGIAARKSVDVNTGEPIVIEGRNKISFTPDASMRDDVNKPFSQFETVVINDGVDFSSIDKEYESGKDIASEKATEIEPQTSQEPIVAESKKAEDNETENIKTDIEKADATQEEEEMADIIQEEDNKPDIIQEKDNKPDVIQEADKAEDKTLKEETKEEVAVSEPAIEDPSAKPVEALSAKTIEEANEPQEKMARQEAVERELIEDEEIHQNHTLRALIITAVVIVIGCVCGGYYLFSQIQKRDSHIEMLEKQMRLVAQHQRNVNSKSKPSKRHEEVRPNQDSIATKVNAKQEATRQEAAEKETANQVAKDEDKTEALQEKYNQDVRIRTGAYLIVGIKKTVTVRPGQTMDGISRSSLGPGMGCYLEAVNGGKRELKAGESINIPQLKLKKRLRR